MSLYPDITPSPGAAVILSFPGEQGVPAPPGQQQGPAAVLARAAIEMPSRRSPVRRVPGVYDAMGRLVVAELSQKEISSLLAIDPERERISYVAAAIPVPDQKRRRTGVPSRARVIDVVDGQDAFRRFVMPALSRRLLAYMGERGLTAIDVLPVVSALNPIDVRVLSNEPYELRRRVSSIAGLLATDRRTAQAIGEVTSSHRAQLERAIAACALPPAITNPLANEARWAHQDLEESYPRLAGQVHPALLVYGPDHPGVEQAYILPRTTS